MFTQNSSIGAPAWLTTFICIELTGADPVAVQVHRDKSVKTAMKNVSMVSTDTKEEEEEEDLLHNRNKLFILKVRVRNERIYFEFKIYTNV